MFTDLLATFTLPLQLYCTTPIFVLRYQHIWDSLLVKNYVLWIKFAEKKIQIHGLFTPESHAMLMTTVWGPDSGLSHRDINNPRILVLRSNHASGLCYRSNSPCSWCVHIVLNRMPSSSGLCDDGNMIFQKNVLEWQNNRIGCLS